MGAVGRVGAFVLLLGLVACGSPLAAAPTATPAFARYTAADVVAEFHNHGLQATDPHPPSKDNALLFQEVPLGSGQVAAIFPEPLGNPMAYLLVFTNAADLEAAWANLNQNDHFSLIPKARYRSANVIFMVYYPQKYDYSSYKSVFLALK